MNDSKGEWLPEGGARSSRAEGSTLHLPPVASSPEAFAVPKDYGGSWRQRIGTSRGWWRAVDSVRTCSSGSTREKMARPFPWAPTRFERARILPMLLYGSRPGSARRARYAGGISLSKPGATVELLNLIITYADGRGAGTAASPSRGSAGI